MTMANKEEVHAYDLLSRAEQLVAFSIDLRSGGPSRIIPEIPSQRQIDKLRGDVSDKGHSDEDPIVLYAQAIAEQCAPYVNTEAARLLGIAAVEVAPN